MKQSILKGIFNGTVACSALVLGMSFESIAKTNSDSKSKSDKERRTDHQSLNDNGDMDITRRIRQDIMKEKDFSTYAQNI